MPLKGVKFGDYHTYLDFGLILSTYTIAAPAAKKDSISILGADGEIDLTEYFGEVNYNNRVLSFEFRTIAPMSEFKNLFSRIQNALHGKKMHIVIDGDDDFYYIGRVNVNEWKSNGRVGVVAIDCDCEPYKYKKYKTIINNQITNSGIIVYENLRKSVVPTFKISAGMTIQFGDIITVLDTAGTYTIPEIVFREGLNTVKYTGTANITVEYQEGGL